jgi:N-acetylglucosaminyl-diphospho-decaprenol L-rhamnosyltransferase
MTDDQWSVITVTYNSAAPLRQCWTGRAKPYDWIVVDNASQDSSPAVAEQLGARVMRLPQNVGFATANNAGVRASTNEYVLFANPDLEVVPEDLDVLKAHLDVYGGLAAPQLISAAGTPQPNGRGFPYATAKLGNRKVWPLSALHSSYRLVAQPGEAIWVAWVMGAAVAARRTEFLRLGGWNERFFLYYEDHELGLRAWRRSACVAVLGDVRWTHHWGRATNSLRWSRAHTLELKAARVFYSMFPEFLLGLPPSRRRHARAAAAAGSRVDAAGSSVPISR